MNESYTMENGSDIRKVFLASPASDYIHGGIITINGGWMDRFLTTTTRR
jgi:hypothetical protein